MGKDKLNVYTFPAHWKKLSLGDQALGHGLTITSKGLMLRYNLT